MRPPQVLKRGSRNTPYMTCQEVDKKLPDCYQVQHALKCICREESAVVFHLPFSVGEEGTNPGSLSKSYAGGSN